MTTTVRAIYENKVLRLEAPLPLKEGATIEVILNLPDELFRQPKRFTWEDGPILRKDSYAGDVADEVRRQREGE